MLEDAKPEIVQTLTELLHAYFGDYQLILRSLATWHSHSQHLNACDFWLWDSGKIVSMTESYGFDLI